MIPDMHTFVLPVFQSDIAHVLQSPKAGGGGESHRVQKSKGAKDLECKRPGCKRPGGKGPRGKRPYPTSDTTFSTS